MAASNVNGSCGDTQTSCAAAVKRVRFTGDVFCNQKFGGVSRYFVELASALNALPGWQPIIDSPFHINSYLKHSGLVHRGIYLPRRPTWDFYPINQTILGIRRYLFPEHQFITHEMYYDATNLEGRRGGRISTFYDMIHERFMPDAKMLRKKQDTFNASDRCIAISQSTKTDMVHYLGVPEEKIDVVYLGSSLQRNEARSRFAPTADYILWVGGRHGYKNFSAFASGLVRSRAWREGIRLVCAGGIKPGSAELDSWNSLGLDPERVLHCQPGEDELASLYSHSILLCYASLYEGFGIPLLEAMACHCPIAASDAGSIPEVVGDCGLLFEPTSTEAICASIDAIYESCSFRLALISKGIARSREFSWANCAAETVKVYDRVRMND